MNGMARVSWVIDVVNPSNDPLKLAREVARYLQEYALETGYEVTNPQGERFGVDLESEVVVTLENSQTPRSPTFGQTLTAK